ncbi:MAG: 4Fe-4S binding protein [candidate division Zixibacteria bacterium]|nr:4Fe-4S binding protein [candidate division Zixibacteria bacterium]
MNDTAKNGKDPARSSTSPAELLNMLLKTLEKMGLRGKIVPAGRIRDLMEDIEVNRRAGLLDPEYFEESLSLFDFEVANSLPEARSIIIIANPQPHLRVVFNHEGQTVPVIIPPIYISADDDRIKAALAGVLSPAGYRLFRRPLPLKTLGVRSGLAQFGKNNIAYVDGMGSYFRLVAFYSDMPCAESEWHELTCMEECTGCAACRRKCPTGAITDDRFLIRAERCLTFHNERRCDFPEWLDVSWHHCLVGCLQCQSCCPANRKVLSTVEDGPVFTSDETDLLCHGVTPEELPAATREKLREIELLDTLGETTRNLRALLQNPGNAERGLELIHNRTDSEVSDECQ